MGREVERKFVVVGDDWKTAAPGLAIRQGYLSTDPHRTVRVRTEGARGVLTVKGLTRGITRSEFEYDIPLADATQLLDRLCLRPLIEKTRHHLHFGGSAWTVDEFHGDNEGLVVAEIELTAASDSFERPSWLGAEVSHDPKYFNANLVASPYRSWPHSEGLP